MQVYSQPGCVFSAKVKEYLSQKQIEFVNQDITNLTGHLLCFLYWLALGFMKNRHLGVA